MLVLRQNCWKPVAPSTAAASYTSPGIICNPANNNSATGPNEGWNYRAVFRRALAQQACDLRLGELPLITQG